MEEFSLEIWKILKTLREKHNLTQDQLAERVMVTRQAVSRWENGETQPNTDTLKLLSKEFGISINTLLGSPRQLICQFWGMPINDEDSNSKDTDGTFNEDYCKWCYINGKFVYPSKDELLNYLVEHMPNPNNLPDKERYLQFDTFLSKLKHWK